MSDDISGRQEGEIAKATPSLYEKEGNSMNAGIEVVEETPNHVIYFISGREEDNGKGVYIDYNKIDNELYIIDNELEGDYYGIYQTNIRGNFGEVYRRERSPKTERDREQERHEYLSNKYVSEKLLELEKDYKMLK